MDLFDTVFSGKRSRISCCMILNQLPRHIKPINPQLALLIDFKFYHEYTVVVVNRCQACFVKFRLVDITGDNQRIVISQFTCEPFNARCFAEKDLFIDLFEVAKNTLQLRGQV